METTENFREDSMKTYEAVQLVKLAQFVEENSVDTELRAILNRFAEDLGRRPDFQKWWQNQQVMEMVADFWRDP